MAKNAYYVVVECGYDYCVKNSDTKKIRKTRYKTYGAAVAARIRLNRNGR